MTASQWPYQSSYPWPFTFSSSRNIADSLKTVLFIGFLYACVMIYHSDYHLYTVSNI